MNQPYEQKLQTQIQAQAQIQAVHAQSPRTVQRNVDQITSEIKKNCDLRKSINFKFNEIDQQEKVDSMECEEHQEPMEEAEEESFQLPSGNINPFDRNLIAGLLKKIKFPQPHHAEGYVRLNINLNKLVPSTTITLGQCILIYLKYISLLSYNIDIIIHTVFYFYMYICYFYFFYIFRY